MKKILLIGLMLLVTNCSYKPIIDTGGRSGTFDNSVADQITNDLQHCRMIAEENTNLVSNVLYWTFNQNMDTKYEALYRKCMKNRGHSILN